MDQVTQILLLAVLGAILGTLIRLIKAVEKLSTSNAQTSDEEGQK